MKSAWLLSFCLVAVGCATPNGPSSFSEREPSSLSSKHMCKRLLDMEIHSHRGAWDRPENMMSAFLRAVDQGADFVELDLQMSKDNHVVVAHDVWLKKECLDENGRELPERVFFRKMTLEKIKTFNCGSKVPRGLPVPGEKISTLEEVLEELKNKKTTRGKALRLNIEIKYNPTQPEFYPNREYYAERVLDVIDKSGIDPTRVMIQSFDVGILKQVRAKRASLRISPLLSDVRNGVQLAQELRAELITPHFSQVNPGMLAAFHAPTEIHPQGIKVVPWTVNDPETAQRLLEQGADGLITDYPEWFSFAREFCLDRKY